MGESTLVIFGIVVLFAGMLVWPVIGWVNAKADLVRARAEHTRAATKANEVLSENLMKAAHPVQAIVADEAGITLPGYH